MTQAEAVFTLVEGMVSVIVTAGLLIRGGWRLCYALVAYLLGVSVYDVLVVTWPERFFTWDIWLLKEAFHNLTSFCIVAELTSRIFGLFPGARRTAVTGISTLVVLLGAAALLIQVSDPTTASQPPAIVMFATTFLPFVTYGTGALFALLLALVLWYRIPLEPMHKAIIMGQPPYMLFYTALTYVLGVLGAQARLISSYASLVSFLPLVTWWGVVAWRYRPQDSVNATMASWRAAGAGGRP